MGRHGLHRLAAAALFAAAFAMVADAAPMRRADTRANALPVDVELIIAVDVYY